MDVNSNQQPSKQPVDQQPYISEEALRPLARMIARRLFAERKCRVGSNVQPGAPPVASEKPHNHRHFMCGSRNASQRPANK